MSTPSAEEEQAQEPEPRQSSNAYNIFILVLTVLSLMVMVLLLFPFSDATITLLTWYDNMICVVFLADFALNLSRSHPKRAYFIGRRGWLDLLGSIPSFGVFKFSGLFRLARLSRFARISRLLRGKNKRELIHDVVTHRGQYAAFVTVLAAFIVLVVSSVLVLQAESHSPDANITTGGDALWWGVVTITTVGYGDYYPVTPMGRMTGFLVMMAGVGIIGALASILASVLVPPPKNDGGDGGDDGDGGGGAAGDASDLALRKELAQIRNELVALRRSLAIGSGGPDPPAG